MPKLLLFVPCERIIVSREGPISLITLLEGVTINISLEQQEGLPADAVVPISWQVATMWLRDANEEDQFEQRIQLFLPDGRMPTEAISAMQFGDKLRLRTIVEVHGFSVSPAGTCDLKLSLRMVGANQEWQEIATYPLDVTRTNPAA